MKLTKKELGYIRILIDSDIIKAERLSDKQNHVIQYAKDLSKKITASEQDVTLDTSEKATDVITDVSQQRELLIAFLMDIDECYGMHVRENAEKCTDEYLSNL